MPVLNKRILVAEDDANVRELIRIRLQIAGYEVHIARDGAEALQKYFNTRPDGVVLDINMPELDGFGFLESLRSGRNDKPCGVLVLTARHAVEDVRRAIGLGAKDYLTKPFSEAQLLARVARLLRPAIPAAKAPAPQRLAI